jgi:hypothetical protein
VGDFYFILAVALKLMFYADSGLADYLATLCAHTNAERQRAVKNSAKHKLEGIWNALPDTHLTL